VEHLDAGLEMGGGRWVVDETEDEDVLKRAVFEREIGLLMSLWPYRASPVKGLTVLMSQLLS